MTVSIVLTCNGANIIACKEPLRVSLTCGLAVSVHLNAAAASPVVHESCVCKVSAFRLALPALSHRPLMGKRLVNDPVNGLQ